MNENIDLTKILKDCPEGWKFYSSIYGSVAFSKVVDDTDYPIRFSFINKYREEENGSVTKEGLYIDSYDGECTFFPSKDQRDWSKFTAPWYKREKFDPKTLQPFDKVLARGHDSHKWTCDFFSGIIDGSECVMYHCINSFYKYCIPYNDDTKHLVDTNDEAPEYYRYWED